MAAERDPMTSLALLSHVEKLIDDKMEKHELEKRPILNEISDKLTDLESLIRAGFPNDDPLAHRKVHEQYIREAAARYAMVQGAKQKVLEGALWAGLVLLCVALWEYVKVGITK